MPDFHFSAALRGDDILDILDSEIKAISFPKYSEYPTYEVYVEISPIVKNTCILLHHHMRDIWGYGLVCDQAEFLSAKET